MENNPSGWRRRWSELPGGMRRFASRAGPADTHVLLLGPHGSGKGYLARILHELSSRTKEPFVVHNCGVFTETLAEARLFGVLKGAFTGATESKRGLVESAAGGTLFLDELAALPSSVQAMLLTFLETGQFSRLGSTSVRKVSVRIIAATNSDLGEATCDGDFRADLVARFPLRYVVPPLSERRSEIRGIVEHYIRAASEELGVTFKLTKIAASRLQDYDWPGNIRELQSVLSYAVLFADTGVIDLALVEEGIQNQRIGTTRTQGDRITAHARPASDEDKRRYLSEALEATEGNKSLAARLLGIDRSTVYRWIDRYDGRERQS